MFDNFIHMQKEHNFNVKQIKTNVEFDTDVRSFPYTKKQERRSSHYCCLEIHLKRVQALSLNTREAKYVAKKLAVKFKVKLKPLFKLLSDICTNFGF